MNVITQANMTAVALPPVRAITHAAGVALVRVLVLMAIILFALPVGLLLANTGVPPLLVLVLALVDGALVIGLFAFRWRPRAALAALLGTFAVAILAVLASQWFAQTAPILGAAGKPLPGSLAVMEKVRLGGVDQWLVIRSKNVKNPVLLFLSGGPGGSELGRVRQFNRPLEDSFTLVVWEQRGCGKSYDAINPTSALTVEQYAADVVELSQVLRARFNQDKIYVLGHSWGTIIGVRAVQKRPDLFHAYIGTGQMVNVRETDQTIYGMLLENARKTGDTAFADKLTALGTPPYDGPNPITRYQTVLGSEYGIFEEPYIKSESYKQAGGLVGQAFIPEYGWIDRINFGRGAMDTFNVVFPQIQDFDFRKDALDLPVPVYFFLGRHDVNATIWLAEEYFSQLRAPSKRLEWFEDSGHGNLWQEPDKFHALMQQVIAETYPPTITTQ